MATGSTPLRDMFASPTGTPDEDSIILYGSHLDQTTTEGRNVNLKARGKPLTRDSSLFGENSYPEDTVCLDNIRTVVREELEHIVNERLAKLISNIVVEKVADSVQTAYGNLQERVSALERKVTSFINGTLEKQQLTEARLVEQPVPIRRVEEVKCGEKSKPMVSQNTSQSKSALLRRTKRKPLSHAVPANKHQSIPEADKPEILAYKERQPANATSDGSWREVRKTRRSPVLVVCGTAAPGVTQLEACERWRYLHLYFIKESTTGDQVSSHLASISGTNVCTAEVLKARGHYASFKLGVPSQLADKIMLPENWPENVCIKPWRQNFRVSSQEKR